MSDNEEIAWDNMVKKNISERTKKLEELGVTKSLNLVKDNEPSIRTRSRQLRPTPPATPRITRSSKRIRTPKKNCSEINCAATNSSSLAPSMTNNKDLSSPSKFSAIINEYLF